MKTPQSNHARIVLLLGACAFALATGSALGEAGPGEADVHAVTGASAPTGHGDGTGTGTGAANMMTQFTEELGLTGQQQTDIQIITSDYAERFGDLAKLGRTMTEDLLSIAPDDPAYGAKTDEASALAATSAAEMVVLLAEMRGKLHAVLTPEQREILRNKIEEKKQQLEERKLQRQQQLEEEGSHDRPLEQFIG